jgi:hypothetical protein
LQPLQPVKLSLGYTSDLVKGFLLDETNALYVDLDQELLYLVGVSKSNLDGIYLQTTVNIALGKATNNRPSTISNAVIKLKQITFMDYLLNHHDRTEDIDFDLI